MTEPKEDSAGVRPQGQGRQRGGAPDGRKTYFLSQNSSKREPWEGSLAQEAIYCGDAGTEYLTEKDIEEMMEAYD